MRNKKAWIFLESRRKYWDYSVISLCVYGNPGWKYNAVSNPPLSATLCPKHGHTPQHRARTTPKRLFGETSVEKRQRTQRQLRRVLSCPLGAHYYITPCKQGRYILFKPKDDRFPDTWRTGSGKCQTTQRKKVTIIPPNPCFSFGKCQ